LRKNSEKLDLEKIAKGNILVYDEFMDQERVGLNFNYDHPNENPFEIYAHKAATKAIYGTLLNNCISRAPKDSNINNGIRINDEGIVEILFENLFTDEPLRKLGGMGKGEGRRFVEMMVKTIGGELRTYHTPQVEKNYHFHEKFGYQNGEDPLKDSEVFGVYISIPLFELTE